MCAKNRVNYFSSFLDIRQNVEWPRFLAHPVNSVINVYTPINRLPRRAGRTAAAAAADNNGAYKSAA